MNKLTAILIETEMLHTSSFKTSEGCEKLNSLARFTQILTILTILKNACLI